MNAPRRPSLLLATVVLFATVLTGLTAAGHDTGVQHVHFRRPGVTAKPATARQADALFEAEQLVTRAPASTRGQRPGIRLASAEESIESGAVVVPSREPHSIMRSPMSHGPELRDPVYNDYGMMGGCASEVGCGVPEPACGCGEPTCGICEPTCGCGDIGCGGCVAEGPDYWCFPVCLPRLKYLAFSLGSQGFRNSRDFLPDGMPRPSNSNFGFNQSIGIGGRTPLIGLVYPQIGYQLGYRAVQSRLSGTVEDATSRHQQFLTGGLYRRTNRGLQFGAVFDLMRDDLITSRDYHQMRYEISVKSSYGREFGFHGATHTNSVDIAGETLQTVDQYTLFFRRRLKSGGEGRIWGGVSNHDEGIFGVDFHTPLSDRWSLDTGFNYLIPDDSAGIDGVTQEGWNVAVNLVWHMRGMGRRGFNHPFRPLFDIADNGDMFVDVAP